MNKTNQVKKASTARKSNGGNDVEFVPVRDGLRGAIVTSSDIKGLSLINAALRAWELRRGFAIISAILLVGIGSSNASSPASAPVAQGAINSARAFMGKVSDDESPCGAFVSDEDCSAILAEDIDSGTPTLDSI